VQPGAVEAAEGTGRFTLQLDPHGLIGTVSLLLWLAVINRLAFTSGAWPRGACVLRIAVTAVSAIGLGCRALGLTPIGAFTSLLNGVLAPAWFVWVGLALRRGSRRAA
jgi:hypothetical protein